MGGNSDNDNHSLKKSQEGSESGLLSLKYIVLKLQYSSDIRKNAIN